MSDSTTGNHPPWLVSQTVHRPQWGVLGGPPSEQLARQAWHMSLHGLDGEDSSVS